MQRRDFVSLLALSTLSSCALARLDPLNILIRSDIIDSPEKEKAVLAKAKLDTTEDGRIRVIYLKGTPYERGYQQGVLLRSEIQENLGTLYDNAQKKFHFAELFDEAYERQRSFMPEEYVEEMHGLAHGARLPLKIVHAIHALPEIGEWGGKKQIKNVVKAMLRGEDLGTTCSNLCADHSATKDGKMYTVRILDWGLHRISRLHKFPLIAINIPDHGYASANIGWMGFLGAISGINEKGITLGEMGYGDPDGESMRGKPMPFLLRDVLSYTKNLKEVRNQIKGSVGTSSYIFLMSDGKTGEAELYIRDRSRFLTFKPGAELHDKKDNLPAIKDIVYGGHYHDVMTDLLKKHHGQITPELLMTEMIPKMAMPSNFQDVVYDAKDLKFWVANAASPTEPAAGQPYTFFDFGEALKRVRKL